jgi:uncharacterized protein YxeA
MKKLVTAAVVLAVVVIAASAFAGFNIPGAPSEVNKAASKATEAGLEQAAKDKINKYDCKFVGQTTQTECNGGKTFPQLVDELRGIVTGGSFAGKSVALKATVQGKNYDLRRDRRNYVRNELEKIQKWYRISVYDRDGDSTTINMTADAY